MSWPRPKAKRWSASHVEILCEGPSKTNEATLMGRTPGNKIVIFEGGERHIGEIFDVAITRSSGFSLYGDPAVVAGAVELQTPSLRACEESLISVGSGGAEHSVRKSHHLGPREVSAA